MPSLKILYASKDYRSEDGQCYNCGCSEPKNALKELEVSVVNVPYGYSASGVLTIGDLTQQYDISIDVAGDEIGGTAEFVSEHSGKIVTNNLMFMPTSYPIMPIDVVWHGLKMSGLSDFVSLHLIDTVDTDKTAMNVSNTVIKNSKDIKAKFTLDVIDIPNVRLLSNSCYTVLPYRINRSIQLPENDTWTWQADGFESNQMIAKVASLPCDYEDTKLTSAITIGLNKLYVYEKSGRIQAWGIITTNTLLPGVNSTWIKSEVSFSSASITVDNVKGSSPNWSQTLTLADTSNPANSMIKAPIQKIFPFYGKNLQIVLNMEIIGHL